MRKILFLGCLCIVLRIASATSVTQTIPLEQQIAQADDIVIVKVANVDGVTRSNSVVTNGDFRTGPGESNTIRLHTTVSEVLSGSHLATGKKFILPLWPGAIMNLSDAKDFFAGKELLVLLKVSPNGLAPVIESDPWKFASDRAKVISAIQDQPRK